MKKIGILLMTGVLVILALTAAAPSLLSTSFGKAAAERIVSARMAGSVEFGGLDLSWTGRQAVEQLVVRDAGGTPVLRIGGMENDHSLLALARNWQRDLGTTVIEALEAEVAAGEDGRTNLMKALAPSRQKKERRAGFIPVIPFASLAVKESRIEVSAPGVEEVVFDVKHLLLDLPGPGKPAGISLAATTRQGGLSGELTAEGTVEDLVDEAGRLQPVLAKVDISVRAANLPVEGIDRAFGYRGQLAAALGRKLDLLVRTRAALDGFDVDLGVSAPNLRADLRLALAGGRLVLVEKARAAFTATPALVEAVARAQDPESPLSLSKSVPFSIDLQQMSLPFGTFDPHGTALTAAVKAEEPMRFVGAGGEDLVVRKFRGALETSDLAARVNLEMACRLERGGSPGRLEVQASLTELFHSDGRFWKERARADVKGKLENVPAALVDAAAGSRGMARELLGPSFDADFSAASGGAGETEVTLSVSSLRLEGDLPLIIGDAIALKAPAVMRATVSPALVRMAGAGESFGLERSAEVSLTVREFTTPRPEAGGSFPDPQKTSVKAVLETTGVALRGKEGQKAGIEELVVSVEADSLERIDLLFDGRVTPGPELAGGVLGEDPVKVSVSARTGVRREGGLGTLDGRASLQGPSGEAAAQFRLDPPYESVNITAPLTLKWTISEETLAGISRPSPGGIGVEGGVPFSLELEPGVYPLRREEWSTLLVRLKADIPALRIIDDGRKPLGSLQDVRAELNMDGSKGVAVAKLNARAGLPAGGSPGTLEGTVTLRHPSGRGFPAAAEAALEASGRAEGLPTSLIALLAGQGSKVITAAGESLDGEGEVRLTSLASGKGSANLRASFPHLEIDAGLTLGGDITLSRPARVKARLTPAGYAALTAGVEEGEGSRRLALQEEARLEAEVTELAWPREGPPGGPLRASVKSPQLILRDTVSRRTVWIRDLEVRAGTADVGDGIDLELSGRIGGDAGGKGAKGGDGVLKGTVSLTGYRGVDGGFSGKEVDVKADLRADAVPVALVDDWLRLEGIGTAALGESLQVEAAANVRKGSGPLLLKAKADNGTFDFDGSVHDGVLRMKKPLAGELKVTAALGRKLLRKIHPIFETVSTSREPLRVEVAAEGFAVPLRDFHIRKAAVPSVKVLSNRLVLRKGGLLDFLIPLAQSFGGMKGVGRGGETEVWFTSLQAGLRDGVFDYRNRLDMLIDGRLHAVSWGSVSLAGDGGEEGGSRYDLFIGLPGSSLRKVLGTDRISDGEIFAIPLRGREGGLDLKSTFAKAALDLGRVRGQYELAQKDRLLGAVVGTLAGEITGTRTGAIPPPSMTPLPWAHLVQQDPPKQPQAPPPPSAPDAPQAPPEKEEARPEDAIREVLPDEMKGVFDLLRKKR